MSNLHERLARTRKALALVVCIDAHTRDVAPEKLPALLRSLTDEQWVAIARHARHADDSEVRPPSEVTRGEIVAFYESRCRRVA